MAARILNHLLLGTALTTSLTFADDSVPVYPHGSDSGAGWDLSSLNDAERGATGEAFVFPETTETVRLYLIDTAVDQSSGWFDDNPILELTESQLIRGSGDPTDSSAFNHGTQVLSIIAGPEAGVSRGTRIEVVSFDIYPQGEGSPSSVGLLATALGEAINHQIENPGTPALICIANGSGVPATSPLLESRVSEAVARGIPVVVAAGNEGQDASQYVPAAYGAIDGVICVGSIDPTNAPLATTNYGSVVDVHAPGDGVGSFHPSYPADGQATLITGTSPATGIVAGLALSELGRQPHLSPSQLENLLKENAYSKPETPALLVVQQDNDFDDDGSPDELERLFGYNPFDASETPPSIQLARSGDFTSVGFTIASDLIVADSPFDLSDGSRWRLLCSTDLVTWEVVQGYCNLGPSSEGMTGVNVVDANIYEQPEEPAGAPEPTKPVYALVDFKDNGEPIVELVDPNSAEFENTLVQAPISRDSCFYRVEWIPARLQETP